MKIEAKTNNVCQLWVDPPRIELGTHPCEGYGIPFAYGPNI